MQFETATSPHLASRDSVTHVMRRVLLALLPGIAVHVFIFGWGLLFQLVLASVLALGLEALMLYVRGQPLRRFLHDHSALVTAWLLAVSLPPLAPWWLITIGMISAIVVAKQLYGGLGSNPFNPAMVAYVVLLVSFPLEMSRWPAPWSADTLTLLETAHAIFMGQFPAGLGGLDALSGATLLDSIKGQLLQEQSIDAALASSAAGMLAGQGWEWVALAWLLGGLWLTWTRTAAWQIPVAMLASLTVLATLGYLWDAHHFASPWVHWFGGATLLGAFFIATDPVSASTTPRGRWLYGAGIGALVFVIRSFGGYPDGVAFAVLLMNIAVPTIDMYTRPRVFGRP